MKRCSWTTGWATQNVDQHGTLQWMKRKTGGDGANESLLKVGCNLDFVILQGCLCQCRNWPYSWCTCLRELLKTSENLYCWILICLDYRIGLKCSIASWLSQAYHIVFGVTSFEFMLCFVVEFSSFVLTKIDSIANFFKDVFCSRNLVLWFFKRLITKGRFFFF